MNQILSTQNNNKQYKNNRLYIKKIIMAFSVLIALFAVIIVGMKIYEIIEKKQNNNPIQLLNKPTIKIEENENVCTLTINYDEGLEKISYYWNEEDKKEQSMNGFKDPVTIQIIIPQGDYNVLNIKATGTDGSVNEMKYEIKEEQNLDKPNISWYYNQETKKIDIVAESTKGIENLTYQWEGEEEIIINSEEENKKELRVTIDAKRGTNKIYIKATDVEGNTYEKSDLIQGVYAPEISVQLVNNKTIVVNIKHDIGFKKVYININGQELIYDENNPQYNKELKNLNASIDVEPGTVTVKISVYTLEEEEKEYTYEASTQISQ